jgi:hypothetical protein
MTISTDDIHRCSMNMIRRAEYGTNGKEQFKLQKERISNMSIGGNGGTPNDSIMTDISGHVGSIRRMHYNAWTDKDFQAVIDIVTDWETTGILPVPPSDILHGAADSVATVITKAHAIFVILNHDDQVDALNGLAERLGVVDPVEDDPQ